LDFVDYNRSGAYLSYLTDDENSHSIIPIAKIFLLITVKDIMGCAWRTCGFEDVWQHDGIV